MQHERGALYRPCGKRIEMKSFRLSCKSVFTVLLISVILLAGCEKTAVYEETFFAMDTVVTFTFYEYKENASSLCFSLLSSAEKELTECGGYLITSESDGQTVKLNDALASVVEKSLLVSYLSDGYYDITVAPLVSLWNVNEATAPPSTEDIASAVSLVGYENISLDGNTLFLPEKGCGVDFGSAGKGYAGDEIAKELQNNGISAGIINLGGNIRVFGENPKNAEGKFVIGIKDPFGKSQIIGSVKVKDTNVITSGAYERFFIYNNERYHHILNPKTGYPANSGLESVTVICSDGALADMLSTALFVAGAELGTEMLKTLSDSHPDIAAIFVLSDGSVSSFNAELYEADFK